ncbi:MAG: class I SAM-dependent methyltransferase [Chlorobium sp.]|nr:class I SAM-dependent methyltransferase [Chlorobium phaeovibrioides]NQU46502.1 class I SAM-dependent methyltransferase [Chlorobium sp.]
MLQLRTAGYRAIDNLRRRKEFPTGWSSLNELEKQADIFLEDFHRERLEVSRTGGLGGYIPQLIDDALRTTKAEHMDMAALPPTRKLQLARALERLTGMLALNRRYVNYLRGIIIDIAERSGRNTRVLELAGGAGGLALALAEEVLKQKLPAEVTSSDIVPAYVAEGTDIAERKRLPVAFRTLDACSLEGIEAGSFDLVIMAQSLHHFSGGQLAMMIAQSKETGAMAFIGIDGFRSLMLTAGVPLLASLQGIREFTMDGLTSARKFYSEPELDALAEIATGKRDHTVLSRWPLTITAISFDGHTLSGTRA